MTAAPHHREPRYVAAAATVRTNADANPDAVCWHDGMTLDQHRQIYGTRVTWTAGHTRPGSRTWQVWTKVEQVPPPGDWLTPEVSRCNYSHNDRRPNPTSRAW